MDERCFLSRVLPRLAKDLVWVFEETLKISALELGQLRLRDRSWDMEIHRLCGMAFLAAEPNALRRAPARDVTALVQPEISAQLLEKDHLLACRRVPGAP